MPKKSISWDEEREKREKRSQKTVGKWEAREGVRF